VHRYTMEIASVDDLDRGAYIIAGRWTPWLSRFRASGGPMSTVEFASHPTALDGFRYAKPEQAKWLGPAGSACMRALLITAASRGLPAVMVADGGRVLAATLAFVASCEAVRMRLPWNDEPGLELISIAPVESWACSKRPAKPPDAESGERLEIDAMHDEMISTRDEFTSFIRLANPCKVPSKKLGDR